MHTRILSVLLTISVMLSGSASFYAGKPGTKQSVGSSSSQQEEASYPMLFDKVEGINIETFCIERPDPEALRERTVSAAEFGVSVQNEDNFKAMAAAISYCRNHPNTCLTIEPGVYHFRADEPLRLEGLSNVLIEGNGAEFIFETQKQFVLSGCDGVELRDLIIDWNWEKTRVASLVKVRNKKTDSFEIEFLELEDVDADIPLASFQQYDKDDLVPGSYGGYRTFAPAEVPGSVVNVEKIAPNVLRLDISNLFTTSFHNEDVYILRHYTYGGQVFQVGSGSKNITFDNIRIYGTAGMGYVFSDKSSHFQVINSYIGLRPGNEDRQRMSTSADGIHILNTGGYFRIDNCDLSFTGDDILNIHDDMLKVTEVVAPNRLIGAVTGGFVQKGDRIRIYNRNFEDIGFETEVVSNIRSTRSSDITLADALPTEVNDGYFLYRSSCRTHNYVISNNYVHETKGRAALLNASDALYENNRLYRTASECLQVRVDVSERNDKIWYEGSGTSNVVIRNNTFEECAFGGKASIITIDCNAGHNPGVLSDVHIENNEFYYCYGELIEADNVSELYIKNNTVIDCGDIIISADCGAIYQSDNTITKPSEACPHTDVKQVGAREAGCFEYGSTGMTYCNLCHTISNPKYIGIPPLNHKNHLEKRIDQAPTCTESGLSSVVCSLCMTVVESGNIEPANGHRYAEGEDICLVCGYGKQVEIRLMSLELDTERMEHIGINLYIDAPDDTRFLVDGTLTEAVRSDTNGLYKLTWRCAPKELSDVHRLTATDRENRPVSVNGAEECLYSGAEYCRKVLSDSSYSEALKDVCAALISYSDQARCYFEYHTEGLTAEAVYADIPAETSEVKLTGILPSGMQYIGSSLILGDEVRLRHYFKGSGEVFFSCVDTADGSVTAVDVMRREADDTVCVSFGVPYSCLEHLYALGVMAEEGGSAFNLCYGVLSYCRLAKEREYDTKLTSLCNALYKLSVSIEKYGKAS